MRYKAVVFDLDGVLCRTDRFHTQAWKQLADRLGLPFGEDINRRLRGVGRMESLEILLEVSGRTYTAERKAALTEEKNAAYRELLERMTPDDLPRGAKKTLDGLRAKGYKLAVASSSRNARFILERLGLKDYFDVVADGTMIGRSKPDPEVFRVAAEMLSMEPEECLVVEDAPAGVQAAAAGNFGAAYLGEEPGGCGAPYRIRDISELLDVIDGPDADTREGGELWPKT